MMFMVKSSKFLARLSLVLFLLTSLATLFTIKDSESFYNPFLRVLRMVFLVAFYMFSANSYCKSFLVSLLLFTVSSVLFIYKDVSFYAVFFLFLSRLALIALVVEKNNIDRFSFIRIFFMFFILGFVVLSYYYSDTMLFYISSLATLALISLLAISFTALLRHQTKYYKFLFLGTFLFAISDALFGAKEMVKSSYINVFFTTIFYNTGYFTVCYSVINKEIKRWK